MKVEQLHKDQIKAAFEKMQSRGEFLDLLNLAKPLAYSVKKGATTPFELKQLTWYASPALGGKRYTDFTIKKKSGADRSIHAPVEGLKSLQKTLSFVLQCVFEPHKAAMGFVRERSIVDNARLHQGARYVYNIDLKDFFPSVDQARVWACLQLKPFNLTEAASLASEYKPLNDCLFPTTEKRKRSRRDIANIIASLCCTEMEVERVSESGEWIQVKRNVLPQGAPTSPVITNIVCQRLDYLLSAVAKRFGLTYSRYADDITFSSMHNVYQPDGDFLKELDRIVTQQGFHIKESKTRLQKDGYRKEVTGLIVSDRVNVQKRYVKELRKWLYYWERYGFKDAERFFLQKYLTNRGDLLKGGSPKMLNVIHGKLEFLKMVKGCTSNLYINLNIRFNKLTKNTLNSIDLKDENSNDQPLSKVVESIPTIGSNNIFIDKDIININNRLGIPIIHNPKALVKLLGKFSENKHPLKYTKHSWEDRKSVV